MKLKPFHLSLQRIESLCRRADSIELDSGCRDRVSRAARIVERAAAGGDAVYGANTGFGKLANTRIRSDQTRTLQRNLILSHCCGVGPDLENSVVRLVMVLKLCSLSSGASGVSWKLITHLRSMLNNEIYPVVPAKGSVGASGDLAPLAHIAAGMIGEGKVNYKGMEMAAADALQRAGLTPLELGPKEGLAMINGTQVSTALALSGLIDTWRLCQTALISGAMSCDALMASTTPFRPEIHRLRGHPGQRDAADCIHGLLSGSDIRESHRQDDERVQDPYCFRCQPQVMGACIDQLRHAARTLENESNSVTDNPVIVSPGEEILSGGNFHAQPVAFAADQCAIVIAEMGSITQRRIATLVDPALNYGLPAFLSPMPGLNSGLMAAEITAAALMSENKQKAAPCSIDSTPTSANQEDHVSMACHGAYRLREMNSNLASIVGIELIAAAQGVDLRAPLRTSPPLQRVVSRLRQDVPGLQNDRYMADDLNAAAKLVIGGEPTLSAGAEFLPRLL